MRVLQGPLKEILAGVPYRWRPVKGSPYRDL